MLSFEDRDLLAGLLAIRNDLVTPLQLAQAIQNCETEIGTRGNEKWVIVKALRKTGALTPDAAQLVVALVEKGIGPRGEEAMNNFFTSTEVQKVQQVLEESGAAIPESYRRFFSNVSDSVLAKTVALADASEFKGLDAASKSGGRFRVIKPHARGGLGEVVVAEDLDLHREVALKQIQSRHADNAEARSRFVLEAEVTGSLEHPGIVPVYAFGTSSDGRPYYAMRFIRGESLQQAIEEFHQQHGKAVDWSSVDFRRLLRRFVDVCQAIAYAHSRGVLHRDLKPGNVMLGKYGETLVVDWGLAKVLSADKQIQASDVAMPLEQGSELMTVAGSIVGTPVFMSPEQASGNTAEIGPATDIYALGATLYQLLTGEPPVSGENVRDVIVKVRAGAITPLSGRRPKIPAALQSICRKALAVKAEDRYATASLLAEDVERWMADEPVAAHRESSREKASRFFRKHRAWATSGAIALIIIAVVSVVTAILLDQSRRAKDKALESEIIQRGIAEDATKSEKIARENESRLREFAEQQRDEARRSEYIADIRAADASWRGRRLGVSRESLANSLPQKDEVDLRGWEWNYLSLRNDPSIFSFDVADAGAYQTAVDLSPDGTMAVARAQEVLIVDPLSGEIVRSLVPKDVEGVNAASIIYQVRFSSTGDRVFAIVASSFCIWDVSTGELIKTINCDNRRVGLWDLDITADDSLMVIGRFDGSACYFDPNSNEAPKELSAHGERVIARSVAVLDDRSLIAVGYDDGSLKIWNAADGSLKHHLGVGRDRSIRQGEQLTLWDLGFDSVKRQVYAALSNGSIEVWDVETGALISKWRVSDDSLSALAILPDSQLLSAGNDQTIRLHAMEDGTVMREFLGHSRAVTGLGFSTDRSRFVSVSLDGTAKLWDSTREPAAIESTTAINLNYTCFVTPDGKRLIVTDQISTRVYDAHTLQFQISIFGTGTSLSRDGRLMAVSGGVWDLERGEQISRLYPYDPSLTRPRVGILFPSGTNMLIITEQEWSVVDVMSGSPVRGPFKTPASSLMARPIFQDEERLLFVANGELKSWSSTSGNVTTIAKLVGEALVMTLSPDTTRVAIGFVDGSIELIDLQTGEVIARRLGHTQRIMGLAFHPSGTRLASSSHDQEIRIWETSKLTELCTLVGHHQPVAGVSFSPDGQRLYSADWDTKIRVWFGDSDLAQGKRQIHWLNTLRQVLYNDGSAQALAESEFWTGAERTAFVSAREERKRWLERVEFERLQTISDRDVAIRERDPNSTLDGYDTEFAAAIGDARVAAYADSAEHFRRMMVEATDNGRTPPPYGGPRGVTLRGALYIEALWKANGHWSQQVERPRRSAAFDLAIDEALKLEHPESDFQHVLGLLIAGLEDEAKELARKSFEREAQRGAQRDDFMLARLMFVFDEAPLPRETWKPMSDVLQNSTEPWRRFGHGWCLLRDGKPEEALAIFDSLLTDPWCPGAVHTARCVALRTLKREAEADEAWWAARQWWDQQIATGQPPVHPHEPASAQYYLERFAPQVDAP